MKTLAVVGDTHTNSTVGLCPPYVQLDDGGNYKSSKLQRALWKAWLDYVDQVKRIKETLDTEVIAVFNGDICDGDHHNTSQIITRNPSTMLKIVYKTLAPLIEVSDTIYVVRGTSAHGGGSGSLEESFAQDIGAVQNPETEAHSWWSLLLDVEGVVVDIAHHNTMGRLPWTIKNAANKLAATTLFKYADSRVRIPDLVFRSHQHRYADSHDNHRVRAICLPGWQGKTEYINRIDPTAVPDVGGAIVTCDKGSYEVRMQRYPFKMSPPRKV